MKNEATTIRLMQTRSLEHLWNRQRREPELTLQEFIGMVTKGNVQVGFTRRDNDQVNGKRQQRLMVKVNGHTSVELKCRTFDYECQDGGSLELFGIVGIRETITQLDEAVEMLRMECRIELLDWHTIGNVCSHNNIEKELMAEIDSMPVHYAIEWSEEVGVVRRYLEMQQKKGDAEAIEVIHAFNRIVNPEKYGST